MNDIAILGSPFTVLVKMPPAEYGKPLRIIEGLKSPAGIAFTSVGNIVVAQPHAGIIILDKNGKSLHVLNRHSENHHFKQPWGVAVDSHDNIYMTDCSTGTLYKLNKNLEIIASVDLDRPRSGVTVHNERVLVINKKSGQLEVFDTNLKLLKVTTVIASPNNELYDIAYDEDGTLYVCGSHVVQILNEKGQHLGFIGDRGPHILSEENVQHFICVDHRYVYITEYRGNCVSIFTKQGDFVASFGKLGSEEGQFDRLYGIAFDTDGILYVSDIDNHRIQLF